YNEGLGVTVQIDSPNSAREHINELLRHIDATTYTDPVIALFTIKLARADYDPDDLPIFDEANSTYEDFQRGSWDETANIVRVEFTDRGQNYTTRTVQAQNLANIETRNGK